MDDERNKAKDYFFEAILSLKSIDECYTFFDDLLTVKELNELSKRLYGAKLLADGSIYADITEKTGLSTATISRINRSLKYGSDGYRMILARLDENGVTGPDGAAS